ncbi:MAG: nitrogen fixation protein FixH [Burkholderiales bacterium]|nr:nitrogen fixation protein FixH [Burkholderiales bacterium]
MSQSDSRDTKPWWKEPYVWLVVGGPLVVVVAAIYTAVIAARNPDPLVDRNTAQQAGVSATTEQTQKQGYDAALAKLQPAHQARNHAASPVVPKAASPEK